MRQVPLHFTDSGGTGDAVLLAHALGCDHRMWGDLVGRLAAAGYRAIAIDARGHGASPAGGRHPTLADMSDDACAVLDRLGIAKTHWVGLSMGGMVGQAFALRHPGRLERLVIANSTSAYGPEGAAAWAERIGRVREGGLAAIRDAVAERYFSAAFAKREPAQVAATMERFIATPVEGYLACCEAIAALDHDSDLPRIRAKTLVIGGEMDIGTPVDMARAMASHIPGARLAVIAGAGHLSAVEQPEAFADLVLPFLAGR
jgi:3-oxoadipate enol-lactonase